MSMSDRVLTYKAHVLSYDLYSRASAFFAKPLMKVPYERAGPEQAVQHDYKSVRPCVLKLQENLSPNWSYDKILIDQVRLGQMGNIWLSVMAHRPHCAWSIHHDLINNNKYMLCWLYQPILKKCVLQHKMEVAF